MCRNKAFAAPCFRRKTATARTAVPQADGASRKKRRYTLPPTSANRLMIRVLLLRS